MCQDLFSGLGDFENAHEHFLDALLAAGDLGGGIRIREVLSGVVKCSGDFDGCSGGQESGLSQFVAQLPVEVILRHGKKDFTGAVRI